MTISEIHYGSGQAGIYPDGLGPSYPREARRHAVSSSPTAESVVLSNVQDLRDHLDHMRSAHYQIRYMDFHTHGADGLIVFSRGSLWNGAEVLNDWGPFEGRGYDTIFAANARVVFLGCTVASGAAGEYFLARAAWVLLRRSGGAVAGYRSYSLSFGQSDGASARLLGDGNFDRVEARIDAGGHVVLHNAVHLRLPSLRRRAERLRQRFVEAQRSGQHSILAGQDLNEAARRLEWAEQRLLGAHHRYSVLLAASRDLDAVREHLGYASTHPLVEAD